MIGKICKAITPFYDFKSHKMKNKSRPALVLAKADNEDYVVIPISKVSHSENIDSYYDVKIDPLNYLIIPELSEPPVRTLGATIPENESHIFR